MDGDHQDEPIGLPHPRFGAIEQSDVECPERPGLVVVSVGYEGPGSGKQMGHIVETFGRWHAASGLLEPVAQVNARTRTRSEEHTSDLQSVMRISFTFFCFKKTTST